MDNIEPRLVTVCFTTICQIPPKVMGNQSHMVLHAKRERLVAVGSLPIAGASFSIDRILVKHLYCTAKVDVYILFEGAYGNNSVKIVERYRAIHLSATLLLNY